MNEQEGKGIVGTVVIVSVVLVALGGGLVWLGAQGMLPAAVGIGSGLDPNVRMIGLIVILAIIALVAWKALPKGQRRQQDQ